MISYYLKSSTTNTFKQIDTIQDGCWINVEQATTKDLEKIGALIGLEMSDLIDSLDVYEIPRIEVDGKNIVLYARNPCPIDQVLYTELLTIIVSANYIITISPQINSIITSLFKSKQPLQTDMRSPFMLHLLLKITQSFTHHIKRTQLNVLKTKGLRGKIESKDILALTQSEEILNQYRSSLVSFRTTLETLVTGRFMKLYEDDKDLLDDLLHATHQCEEICEVNLKSIRSLRDCYQIIFTNSLNKTIKLLTALTIIFTIPTIIASLYGMNVSLPFAHQTHAFLGIILGTLFFSAIATWIFRQKKWL